MTEESEYPMLMYREHRVMTFAMIDGWLGVPEGTVEFTFKENQKQFFVRRDYFLVTHQDRDTVEPYGVSVPTRGLMVVKQAGFDKLMALLGTDITDGRPVLSWDPVFTVSPALRLVGGLDAPDDIDSIPAHDGEPDVTTIQIADTEIPLVTYEGKPVVTFAMIDQVHGRPEGTAQRNFSVHKRRLVEEKHFYLVDFSKNNDFRTFGINVPTRGLTVLTEVGYLMLVKSFTDDLAWQVQGQLVESYFRAQDPEPQPALPFSPSVDSGVPPINLHFSEGRDITLRSADDVNDLAIRLFQSAAEQRREIIEARERQITALFEREDKLIAELAVTREQLSELGQINAQLRAQLTRQQAMLTTIERVFSAGKALQHSATDEMNSGSALSQPPVPSDASILGDVLLNYLIVCGKSFNAGMLVWYLHRIAKVGRDGWVSFSVRKMGKELQRLGNLPTEPRLASAVDYLESSGLVEVNRDRPGLRIRLEVAELEQRLNPPADAENKDDADKASGTQSDYRDPDAGTE